MIDGTPCGYAGTCSSGECVESSWFGKLVDWFLSNLQISVPVTVAVGLFVIAIIWSLIGCCVRKARYGTFRKPRPPPNARNLPVVHTAVATVPAAYVGGYTAYGTQSPYAQQQQLQQQQQQRMVAPQDAYRLGPDFAPIPASQRMSPSQNAGRLASQRSVNLGGSGSTRRSPVGSEDLFLPTEDTNAAAY
ncbi:hypothetical protein HDU84_005671, partial [Entophlyctis sp. JEL0112]